MSQTTIYGSIRWNVSLENSCRSSSDFANDLWPFGSIHIIVAVDDRFKQRYSQSIRKQEIIILNPFIDCARIAREKRFRVLTNDIFNWDWMKHGVELRWFWESWGYWVKLWFFQELHQKLLVATFLIEFSVEMGETKKIHDEKKIVGKLE